MKTAIDTCVIPAAGAASRFAGIAPGVPKCLLQVAGAPIISHQLAMLRSCGITRVLVAVDSQSTAEAVSRAISPATDVEFNIDRNPHGIAGTLSLFKNMVNEPFMVLLGDVYIHRPQIVSALESFAAGNAESLLFTRHGEPPNAISESFEVLLDEAGRVLSVEEKPANPKSNVRGCGLYLFRKSIFDAISRTAASPVRNEIELTDSILELIESGAPVDSAELLEWDFNINTPADLLECNLRCADESGDTTRLPNP